MADSTIRGNIRYGLMLLTTLVLLLIVGYGAKEAIAHGPKQIAQMKELQDMKNELLSLGIEAPNFILPGIDGKDYELRSYRGKKLVMVELFATWCPHCQASVEPLTYLYKQYGKKMELLSINAGDKPPHTSTSKEFQAAYGIPYPILEEPSDSLLESYRLEGFPTMYLVNKQGKIIFAHTGSMHEKDVKAIEALLEKESL